MAGLASLTAHELGARYRDGTATPTQAVTECLARIEALDPQVRAFLTVTGEDARRREAAAQRWGVSGGEFTLSAGRREFPH